MCVASCFALARTLAGLGLATPFWHGVLQTSNSLRGMQCAECVQHKLHSCMVCACGTVTACQRGNLRRHVEAAAALAQVLPYWTKASLSNLAAVVCWRHAASLSPASIRVTQLADGTQDADQDVSTAMSFSRMPEKIVPLEVCSRLPVVATSQKDSSPHAPAAACPALQTCLAVMGAIPILLLGPAISGLANAALPYRICTGQVPLWKRHLILHCRLFSACMC